MTVGLLRMIKDQLELAYNDTGQITHLIEQVNHLDYHIEDIMEEHRGE